MIELKEDFVKYRTSNSCIIQSVRLIFTSYDRSVVRMGVAVLEVSLIRALILLEDAGLDIEPQEAMLEADSHILTDEGLDIWVSLITRLLF